MLLPAVEYVTTTAGRAAAAALLCMLLAGLATAVTAEAEAAVQPARLLQRTLALPAPPPPVKRTIVADTTAYLHNTLKGAHVSQ
jgi:hypothetical protein